MRDQYIPASLLACACLAVAVVGTFQAASSYRPKVEVAPVIRINVDSAPDTVPDELPTSDIIMPETRILAPAKPDPLSGPSKRCSQGAWFQSRPLEQGSGNVRGFCP